MRRLRLRMLAATLLAALVAPALVATASADVGADHRSGAVVAADECSQNELPRNDDGSTSAVTLPFGVNFYGETFTSLWVNNNGNVTFDGPLRTYTPFGLTGTSASIIAPFFADVDTRGTGSDTVSYGWGETVYEGHRAFCVNWVNVGYFSGGTDKLNSFQLLLVEREDADPGDFDIVFNYDSVQWESGSASGGTGGLGGSTARAGFSNGTGAEGTYFEIAGSGESLAFLDSSPTGLARTSTDSTQVGRHVWKVRSGAAPATEYVALGDSFQSGEGTDNYWPGTDTDANRCHRSPEAYPELLVARRVVDLELAFWACSGAVIADLTDDAPSSTGVPWDDPFRLHYAEPTPAGMTAKESYLDRLSPATKLVTIGIGGNDLGFAAILKDCVMDTAGDLLNPFHDSSCESEYGDTVDQRLEDLKSAGAWTEVFSDVRRRAPFARVVVLGYPRFYVDGGNGNRYNDNHCAGVRVVDQRWINREIADLNEVIRDSAEALGMQYVDIYDAGDGHELCSRPDTDDQFMNGIEPEIGNPPVRSESYHPNGLGHSLIADRVEEGLRTEAALGVPFLVHPDETVTSTHEVTGAEPVSFSTSWPGSDVVMTLTTPSGRVIDRSTAAGDVRHDVGPTFETYTVADPEPGTWTVELFGARVAAVGEETRLSVFQAPVRNQDPVAAIEVSQDGRTVTVDASGSTDSDGTVVEHLWEFGDGTTATGPVATHTYEKAGEYLVTLAIRDDDGGEGFAAADGVLTVPAYDFTGFHGPVDNPPAVNVVKAGRAVPLTFGLGGDHGLDVLAGAPTFQTASCETGELGDTTEARPAGGSSLSYDPATDTYTYPWKTDSVWAGSCGELTLALDDGSSHTLRFRFR